MDDYYGYGYTVEKETPAKPGDHQNSKDILRHRDRVKELKKSGLLTKLEQQEIVELEAKIEKVRKDCIHDFQPVILAQYRRKYCTKCDAEDYTYDYRKD